MLNFKFIVLLHFWNVIIGKVNRVQKRPLDPIMNFKEAAADIESPEQEVIKHHIDLSKDAAEHAKGAKVGESRSTDEFDDVRGCMMH